MVELWNIESAKCNLKILVLTENFRIQNAEKRGQETKLENHTRHKAFLLEIYEVFTILSNENTVLQSRNMELYYENQKVLQENKELKEKNKHLTDGL